MPQCFARKRRFTLTVFPILLLFILLGCSMAELERIATENKLEEVSVGSGGTGSSAARNKYLSFDSIIKGGRQSEEGFTGAFRRLMIGPDQEVQLMNPVAVGGVNNYLYIVDAGLRIVFRYDLVTNLILPIGNVGAQFVGEPGSIYVARDQTFYIVDSMGKQVFHFDEQGNVLQVFQDLANLSRPMDIVMNDLTDELLVADGSFSHVLVFNKFGKAVRAIGQRGTGTGRFRAITGITVGTDGLYVLDRLEIPVQVVTMNGEYKYSFGESYQTFPTAIAVNEDGIVYVADKSDNTIRIYQDAELLSVFGGTGSAPGRFRMITSMWVNNDLLYVADSMNRRVQVLRMTPDAPVPAALNQ